MVGTQLQTLCEWIVGGFGNKDIYENESLLVVRVFAIPIDATWENDIAGLIKEQYGFGFLRSYLDLQGFTPHGPSMLLQLR